MKNDNALYWIWFSLALGFSQHKVERIYSIYRDISVFYHGKEFEWRLSGLFNNAELNKLSETSLDDAEKILKDCQTADINAISIENELYPQTLREIYAPPAVIYVKGNLPDFENTLTIAMVGTRKATRYGVKTAFDFAYNLSKYGVITVSGGALGVDSASHNGSLRADGITVCVLGCGICSDYLRQNKSMREAIAVKGALISEYPPYTDPKSYYFPARNRIISALSDGVLVMEAGSSSGSLITANYAAEQGKDVFAVMGNIDSPMSRGSNMLIKDGAVPVSDFRDILNHFPNLYSVSLNDSAFSGTEDEIRAIPVKGQLPEKIGKATVRPVIAKEKEPVKPEPVHRDDVELSEFERKVYEAVEPRPLHIDELAAKLSSPLFKLLPVMTKLEIQGLIENVDGRCYRLV